MLSLPPIPVLNKKELELLDNSPEVCLQHAVQRGAFSLDSITEGLPVRVAAVVRSIATNERLDALEGVPEFGKTTAGQNRMRSGMGDWERERKRSEDRVQQALSDHPQLTRMLGERILTLDEAMAAAHVIDGILGRYMTGTRYAVP